MNILVIDDDASLRRTLRMSLEVLGHRPPRPATAAQALELLGRRPFEVALLDLRLAQEQGLDLLPRLLGAGPGAARGGRDGLCNHRNGRRGHAPRGPGLPAQAVHPRPASAALGSHRPDCGGCNRRSRSWRSRSGRSCPRSICKPTSRRCARPWTWPSRPRPAKRRLLLRGESGTGKGVLARAIHARSPRAAGPFVTVHCPSLSAELLESELFGHVQGAFTGAVRDTIGKVAAAEGGTLLLDEIGDLPLPLQPKLLRLLQERCYERVGETQTRASNVRILAATNHDLKAEIAAGRFREDLFYRLNVIEVTLPPLRGRAATTSSPWPNTCCDSSPGKTARRCPDLPRRCARPCCATLGRATSASCATWSSGA